METIAAFIGAGSMGGVLLEQTCSQISPACVTVHRRNAAAGKAQAKRLGCVWAATGAAAVRDARYVMLCVKPQNLFAVLDGLLPAMRETAQSGPRQVLVSIAAGVSLEELEARLETAELALPVIRVMPNTPAAVGRGVLLTAMGRRARAEDLEGLRAMLSGCGTLQTVTEAQLDMGCAISGCGPAFVYLFIEALADGGVEIGLPRDMAQDWAARTVQGAAEMVLKTGLHPGALKDAVCSPGGSTIAGVAALERRAFRSAAAQAVVEAYQRFQR